MAITACFSDRHLFILYSDMNLQARTGLFFIIIGIFSWVIFIRYLQAGSGGILYFVGGAACLILGWLMWNRWRTKPSNRYFRMLRRRSARGKEDQE